MKRLEGKTAIVTGAGQGIGRAVAIAFAEEGARVVLAGRTEAKVAAVCDELDAASLVGVAVRCDVGRRDDIEATVACAVDTFGGVDILVNNAATGYLSEPDSEAMRPIHETSVEYFQHVMNVNAVAPYVFMQLCFPHMRERGGKIINLASVAGTEGLPMLGPYAASKEALRALTRVASREWGPFKINVNTIIPVAASPSHEDFGREHPEIMEAVIAQIPLGYVGDCKDDIAPVAVFLASEDSRYVSGQSFMVDGGRFTLR